YAILGIFIAAAVLTSSADAWNQTMFAAPMIALYLLSIGIAWLVAPRGNRDPHTGRESTAIRLVVGAMVIDQARRRHDPGVPQSSSAGEWRHAGRGRPYRC